MNLFKQFVGAYTRQIARNVANDNYYQKNYIAPIKESRTNIKVNQVSTLEFVLWLIGCLIIPYFCSIVILIKGLVHLLSDKANVTFNEKETVYHIDRRYRNNYNPSQTYIQNTTKTDKFLKSELDPQEIRKYNRNAIIYILIGALSIFFWYKMFVASESEMEDCIKWTSYTYDPMGKDYDEIFQPRCKNIYKYEFILPKIKSSVSRDAMLVRKNDSLYLCVDDNLFYKNGLSLHDSISIIMDNKEERWTLERNDEYIFKLIKDSVDFTPEDGYNIYYIGKENISDVRMLKIYYGGSDAFIFYPHSE